MLTTVGSLYSSRADSPSSQGTQAIPGAGITSELYRLFVSSPSSDLTPSPPLTSPSSPPTSHFSQPILPMSGQSHRAPMFDSRRDHTERPVPTPWDEFHVNGRESELDELDLLLRGLDLRDGDVPARFLQMGFQMLVREGQRSMRRRMVKGKKVCVFCRNNGEAESVYTSHQLKDAEGKITCPVLFIYTCPICGASGPNAHTVKYCPLNPGDTPNIRSLRTARTSAGKRRF